MGTGKALWWIVAAPLYGTGFLIQDVLWPLAKGGAKLAGHIRSKPDGLAGWKQLKSEKDGLLLGYLGRKMVRAGGENSVLMFGKRGSGKTQTGIAMIKNLIGTPDLIVADDHGDIEAATRAGLEKKGFTCLRIDLGRPDQSDCYDPLSFLRPFAEYGFEDEVQQLCLNLIVDSGKENEVGRHFNRIARGVLEAVIISEAEKFKLTMSDIADVLVANPKRRDALFEKLKAHPNALVRSGINALEVAGQKSEKGGIETTMARELRPWLMQSTRMVTSKGDLDFDEMFVDPQPHCIFVRTGGDSGTFGSAIVRIIMGNAIYSAKRQYNQTLGGPLKGKLPKGLVLFADEPENMGDCEAFIQLIRELRKVGLNIFLPFQSLAALKATYKEWHVVLMNCVWLVAGKGGDLELYERVEKLAGQKTVTMKTTSKHGDSEHESKQAKLTAAEIRELDYEKFVCVGEHIAIIEKPFKRA